MNSRRLPNLQMSAGRRGVFWDFRGEWSQRTRTLSVLRSTLKMPLWLLQIASGAKSFKDNPIIGSKALNRLGLHTGRLRVAHALADWRRWRLSFDIPASYRAEFAENGYIRINNYLPEADFLTLRDAVLNTPAPAREMLQGDTITRRIAVDSEYLKKVPLMRSVISADRWKGLLRYVASATNEPLYYIQTILTHRVHGDPDPQTSFHADTFHPTMKAWYFLEDVAEDEGAFCYVPGSHRLTPERLAWEKARSIAAPDGVDALSAKGSMRVEEAELEGLGLRRAERFGVKANTLVIADTFGFHARGHASRPTRRVEIWAYGRRNPFYPWLGFDLFSLPGLAERRIPLIWAARDRFPRLFGSPMHPAETKLPLAD
jgi:hypothetical protein